MRCLLANDLTFVFVLVFLGFICFWVLLNVHGNFFCFLCSIQRIPIVYVILLMIHVVVVHYFSADGSTVELR